MMNSTISEYWNQVTVSTEIITMDINEENTCRQRPNSYWAKKKAITPEIVRQILFYLKFIRYIY